MPIKRDNSDRTRANALRRLAPIDRVWAQVERAGPDDCWLWTSCLTKGGYGAVRWTGKKRRAHRVVYEIVIGSIPEGMQLDHLCRVRHCVNPAHLEPVTPLENFLRGESFAAVFRRSTTCVKGHPFDAYNGRARLCRTCRRQANVAYRLRIKESKRVDQAQ